MMALYYYNWNGTMEELKKYEAEAKKKWAKIEGVKIIGMYTPTIAWNRAWLFETDSADKLFKNSGERSDKIRNTDVVFLL